MQITDEVINTMLGNAQLRDEFDFLASPPQKTKKPAKCCGGSTAAAPKPKPVTNTNAIRKRIANLPPKRLARMKEMLGVDRLRVRYKEKVKGKKRVVPAVV